MIIAAIIIGIILLFLIFLTYINDRNYNFNNGLIVGIIITMLLFIEVILIVHIIGDSQPTTTDVYQGKTTLEYKVVDDVKVDSVVIFKNDTTGLNIY